jgi:dipeptidyl aminopeptidase/acylaminoacyl peptidase
VQKAAEPAKKIMLCLKRKLEIFIRWAAIGGLGGLFLALYCVSSALAQDGDLFPVPGTYQLEGIPPIKNSDVANLFYDPSAIRDNLIWDADRRNRRLLVTDETNSVYLLNTPLSQPVKLLDKIVPNTLKTRPNREAFAYTDDHEHEDNYQLYYYDFKVGAPKKLTTLTGKDESVESFVWSQSGDSLLYSKVDYDAKTSKVCQNDLITEKCFQLDLKGIWNVLDGNRDKILLKYWKASSAQHLYLYDVRTSKLAPLDEKGNSRKGFLIGERVFWTSEGNDICGKISCILSLNLRSGEVKKLELPKSIFDIDDVKFSPSGTYILVQDSKDGIDSLHILRVKKDRIMKEILPFISGPFVIWNTRWLSDTEIAYTLENIGRPASIHSFNVASKQTTDWTKERLPTQLEDKIRPPEIIRWRSFDQKEITGYVVRPKLAAKKSPVLIYVHGGPQILDKPTFNSLDIRFASNLGLTIIHTNIRGSSGFGDEFMDSDNKDKRGDAVKDIQALLDWIKTQPDLDSDRIYLRGQSYGGFIVLSTALQEPLRIKGVVAEYPVVSIRGMLSESWIDEFAKNEYGDPINEDLMGKLDQLSPLNNSVRWNKIPLFLTRGKLDVRNPEKDVTDLKAQIQRGGSDVWYIYSTSDGHGFSSKYVVAAMYEFLKKQINNKKENVNEKN